MWLVVGFDKKKKRKAWLHRNKLDNKGIVDKLFQNNFLSDNYSFEELIIKLKRILFRIQV